jgi:pimeloyl-ACP methyl ester carboxylesterase
VGGLLWLLAPLVNPKDPSDMIATIRAEDTFDVGDRLGEITTPTLVIGGDRDFYYGPELFSQTAERMPNAHLLLYRGRTHVTAFLDLRFTRDIMSFLLKGDATRT